MKRYLILLFTLCSLLAAGCANPSQPASSAQPGSKAQQQEQQAQTPNKAPADQDTQSEAQNKETPLAKLPTIGDSQTDWENEWGHPYNQGDTLRLFHDGRYQVVFQNGRAVTVTIQVKNGEQLNLNDYLPEDAQKQSVSTGNPGGASMSVEKWHSQTLEKALSTTKGNFTVMRQSGSIIIDCTPDLKK